MKRLRFAGLGRIQELFTSMMKTNVVRLLLLGLTFATATGCVRRYAINKLGDALARSGDVYASDNDPELIQSAPFSLKLIESLVAESPRHSGLLLAAARGFTQYAYAFVQEQADEMKIRTWLAQQL
jgi:TRAP transporter T-component